MTAAKITPTFIGKELISQNMDEDSTTTRRMARLHLEGPKASISDWFLLSDYLTAAQVKDYTGHTEQLANNTFVLETFTYDADDAKLVLGHASAGTSHVVVTYYE